MLAQARTVADLLGVETDRRTTASLQLIARIEDGLPVDALDRLAEAIAPEQPDFKHRLVPRATLARRRRGPAGRLTPEEGDRLTRIASVWAHAVDVWKGEDAARAFLLRPHPLLEGRRPLDVALSTELGGDLVDGVLGRLEHGSAV